MLPLELVTDEGKRVPIKMPQNASEVKLNKYIDLETAYKKLEDWVIEKDKQGLLYDHRTYYAYRVGQILSEFFSVDLTDILSLPAEDLLDNDGQILPGVLKEHLGKLSGVKESVPDITGTLFSLLEYLKYAVLNYSPNLTGSFEYKGETWIVPELRVMAYNQIEYPKLTVLQTIESLEVRRGVEQINDDGSSRFSAYLNMLAILCTKKGEKFSVDAFNTRVAARTHHFRDVSMDIAMNVIFFSQLILTDYLKKTVTDISLKKPHLDPEFPGKMSADLLK